MFVIRNVKGWIVDFFTFITMNVIIVVSGGVIKNYFTYFQPNRDRSKKIKDINMLKKQIEELKKYPVRDIEKRLQTIESIVVDQEYNLIMKFKKIQEEK